MPDDGDDFMDGDIVRFNGVGEAGELQPGEEGRVVGRGADGDVFVRWATLGVQAWSLEDARRSLTVVRT